MMQHKILTFFVILALTKSSYQNLDGYADMVFNRASITTSMMINGELIKPDCVEIGSTGNYYFFECGNKSEDWINYQLSKGFVRVD